MRQMSIDLKKTFPDMTGFSETNLKTMRLWYRFYAEAVNGQQVVDELRSDDIFRLITTIPWGHNQRIIFKCNDVREAVFYAQYTLENNWSRDVLEHQIESGLYERKGRAITNFKDKTQFLLELGTGFSYVGRQVQLQVGEREFCIDLLFYHIKLHCYVVVELKTKRFEPEYVGKLNFYVTAVNKQLTGNGDNPAIGLLICKDKDNVVAEYSLEEVSQPIGITGYELSNALSKEYQHSLPTIETLESEVAKMMDTK